MLVLTIKEGDSVRINADTQITFARVKASHVKIAIEAPQKVNTQTGIRSPSPHGTRLPPIKTPITD